MITLLLAAACGVLGTVQYEQHNDYKNLRADHQALVQTVDNHEGRITTAEETLVKHRRGLDYLHDRTSPPKPTSQAVNGYQVSSATDWMKELK